MKTPKAILTLQKNLKNATSENELMKVLFQNQTFRKLIIDLNTQEQLFEQGIDSKGRSLGEYSIATIEGTRNFLGKKQKGQRFDHITLNDTGAFYRSFAVQLEGNTIRITADGQKEDTNLFQEYGIDIVGLTEDSMSVLATAAIPIIQKHLKTALTND
jgi:hypothetical protein